jgi:hypothetical protein
MGRAWAWARARYTYVFRVKMILAHCLFPWIKITIYTY